MKAAALVALCLQRAVALPRLADEKMLCERGRCDAHGLKYERVMPSQPGYQWDDAGGYCGSWATQRAALTVGAWISQQQVRDHASDCGGHDSEILSCNIEEALTGLKLEFNAWDYKNESTPQTDAYAAWLKAQLAGGHAVAWMIMWSGQDYPIYDLTPPDGMYGHVEPVIGVASNHPLNDTTVYDDDVVLHYTDGGVNTVQRGLTTLAGEWAGPGEKADCGDYQYCVGNPYGFGWAIKGYAARDGAVAASLRVAPFLSEPDTRSGEAPESLRGTVTATGLTPGAAYDVYRWDDVENVGTFDDAHKSATFTASKDAHVYVDDKSIPSDGTTYYKVVLASA